jgi:hypothetical protein
MDTHNTVLRPPYLIVAQPAPARALDSSGVRIELSLESLNARFFFKFFLQNIVATVAYIERAEFSVDQSGKLARGSTATTL